MLISRENVTRHIPVMKQEVLDALGAERGGEFLDCTLGGGGHAMAVLEANTANRIMAIDRDLKAVSRGLQKFEAYSSRIMIKHGSFTDLEELVKGRIFDGILADLGVSTDQLRENRSFSFSDSARLDMRMDETQALSAYAVVNETSERDLFVCLKQGGVGSSAKAIARAIVRARPIVAGKELAEVICAVGSVKAWGKKINPATVVFQAIRMSVNQELKQIRSLTEVVPKLVRQGSRFAVITFHSLEDRAVTSVMRNWESGEALPASWPGRRLDSSLGRMLYKKPQVPSEQEVELNPSARSARLRIFEFTKQPPSRPIVN